MASLFHAGNAIVVKAKAADSFKNFLRVFLSGSIFDILFPIIFQLQDRYKMV
jgi:hypothetical protein